MDRKMIKIKEGFSVVELIIVIGIMAIIATIAIPEFTKWKTKYSIESDVKEIKDFLQQARMKAFTEKIELDVFSDASGKKICFKCDSNDSDCTSKYGTGNISCLDLENTFTFSNFGISKRGTLANRTIRYSGSYSGNITYDCIAIKSIRIKAGKYNGTKCVVK
jgi:prepilin-type N-terminal cleavage/methylation domain-containing protein